MENEKNGTTTGVSVHDIVVLSKYQKTGENGEKKGYSFYTKDAFGLVMQVNEEKLVMKMPDGEEEVYNVQEEDEDYYYRIGKGSEIEYENGIKKAIDDHMKDIEKKQDEVKDLTEWLYDFKHSISFLGKVARFIKDFK